MARTGGRFPWDKLLAVTGPARVLWAEATVTTPANLNAVIQQVANASGEYPVKTGWNDFGLAAEAPSYSRNLDTEALDYEQVNALFEEVSEITRQFTAQISELDSEALKIIENTQTTTAVAASSAGAADGVRNPAGTLVHAGLFTTLRQYRMAWIFTRPSGSGANVVEPGPPVVTRPAFVARIFPLVQISADEAEFEAAKGEPVNIECAFDVVADTTLAAGKEHGYWAIETPSTITP